MTEFTLTDFRKDIFRITDGVLDSGEPVRIRRRGRTLMIVEVPDKPPTEADERARRFDAFMESPSIFEQEDIDEAAMEAASEAYSMSTEVDKL